MKKPEDIKVLVGCEESKRVRNEFLKLGFDAYSNDIVEAEGGNDERHLQMDVFEAINVIKPDVLIAFPPCTYLTCTANRSFLNNPSRWEKRLEAVKFFHKLLNAHVNYIALENPKGVISSHIRKPDQYIQPFQYGHSDSKMTGLWLKNLPLLIPTNIVEPEWITSPSGKRHSKTHWQNPSTNNPDKAKLRSKTYPGIAKAMAEQWGEYILNN